jgi:hypothetical protein
MLASLAAAILAGSPSGCSTAHPQPGLSPALAADTPPPDFTLAVTVHAQPGTDTATLPRSRRPAQYVMEADWVLRVALGTGAGEEKFPARTRQLSAGQAQRLWQDLRDSGLLEESPGPTTRPNAFYTIHYVADGMRRTLHLDSGSISSVQRLVDDLGALAWVPE